jgi:hypothetical protein
MADIDIIPGELVWAPEVSTPPHVRAPGDFWLQDSRDEYFRKGGYAVPHYPVSTLGGAFGPLAFDQTLSFCQALDKRLAACKQVRLRGKTGDNAERANTAVLLGAYLLLRRRWSLKQVECALSWDAELGFLCSWSGRSACGPPQPPVMKVRDCWAGLEMALRLGWLDIGTDVDKIRESLALSQYRQMALQFDAVWVCPGEVMVSADPMSTIRDPNPITCSALLPAAPPESTGHDDLQSLFNSPATMDSGMSQQELGKCYAAPFLGGGSIGDKDGADSGSTVDPVHHDVALLHADGSERVEGDASSCHTVGKNYAVATMETVQHGSLRLAPPKDFISFCKDKGVSLVVRTNFGDESGLVEHGGTYEARYLRNNGLKFLGSPLADSFGGVPSPATTRSFLASLLRRQDGGAILVHCKGGFGRSVVLACCLLIHRHDVPGRALLAWARIVRPGAVTTPQQERFLCGLGGRGDLERYSNFHYQDQQQPACCVVA